MCAMKWKYRMYFYMLCDRWWSAHRKRFLGGACKLPTGAMVKNYGAERVGKGLQR